MSVVVNKVFLAGNVASEIVSAVTTNGTPVANFRLAVNVLSKNDNSKTVFIDVAVFGKAADAVAKYCQKGSLVLVEGRLDEDQWQGVNEEKRFKHFITAQYVQFLNSPKQDNEAHASHNEASELRSTDI